MQSEEGAAASPVKVPATRTGKDKGMAWGRTTAAVLLGMALGSGAAADTTLTREYFIGFWGIGGSDECLTRDTMSFYDSGAWAVTNGGGNPVEAIGLWQLDGTTVKIIASDIESTAQFDILEAQISDVTVDSFTMVAEPLQGGKAPLYRCS